MDERYTLAGDWTLRRCVTGDPQRPQWAIQFKGMDWCQITDFLPPAQNGRSTLDDDMRNLARAIEEERGF